MIFSSFLAPTANQAPPLHDKLIIVLCVFAHLQPDPISIVTESNAANSHPSADILFRWPSIFLVLLAALIQNQSLMTLYSTFITTVLPSTLENVLKDSKLESASDPHKMCLAETLRSVGGYGIKIQRWKLLNDTGGYRFMLDSLECPDVPPFLRRPLICVLKSVSSWRYSSTSCVQW